MASKGYMIWTCDRALPEETIEYIQNTIGRRKLYGAVLNDTNTTTPNDAKATYNCAEDWKKDWKKYRNEWEKILMDGSRFGTVLTASLPSNHPEPYFWQGPLVRRFIKNKSPSKLMKAQPCPESIAFIKPLDEALSPTNGMFKIYRGSEHLQTEEELRASGIPGETVFIARNQLLVIRPVWVETSDEGGAIFLWAGYSSHLIELYDYKARDFIQAAYTGGMMD
ncbi:sensitivity to high expression protein she10 [Talaromyces marneffei ATCC 18224]|uniref:Uncharacterized protein n=1 Tax=Talaromyces marneffei (strain ATCC 18224 / CBS 334.59 / QM 7333) TaxID=441960 RepID=B6QEY0_TALMQ|nr:hypothetical protein PMAA_090000 [Talaromyces marneffei ATCC 18224]